MLVAALFIMMLSTSNQHPMRLPRSTPPQYELIHETETTTEETGSITMQCRDAYAAEPISLSEVEFWLNRTRVCDPSLQEQDNFNVVEVDSYRIKFNLTRRLEGIYTCGRCVNESYVLESTPKTFTSLQTLIPVPNMCNFRNYTASPGDRVVLPCPIEPGALLQSYSVTWTKDNIEVASASDPQNIKTSDCKYDIDRATYALIIDPVSVNDSSTDYQCQVYVNNPITGVRQELHYSPQPTDLSLLLTVLATSCAQSPTAATTVINNYYYFSNTTVHAMHMQQCNSSLIDENDPN